MFSFLKGLYQLLCLVAGIVLLPLMFYLLFLHAGWSPGGCSTLDFANRKWVKVECADNGSGI
jgi:hypothetical protein